MVSVIGLFISPVRAPLVGHLFHRMEAILTDLRSLVPAHRAIVEAIRAAFPDETEESLADTIEGESDLPGAVVAVLRAALEREAQAKAIKDELIARLLYRAHRLEDGAKSLRAAALQAMQEAGLPKIQAIDMSVSVGRGKPRVIITDTDLVPDWACIIKREPSKAAISKVLATGTDVPGVTLGNPQPFLTIHRG
jgi:hypothetical protein